MPPSNSNPINTNRVPALFAVSNVDGKTPVYLWADPTTHGLVVEATASIDAQSIPATGLTEAVAVQIVDGSGNQITSFGSGDTNLTQVGGANITLGQKPMATSLPVAIASDQSAIPVSQSGTWNITDISGTISLPTGAATSANQTNGQQVTQITDSTGDIADIIESTATPGTFGLVALNPDGSNISGGGGGGGDVNLTQVGGANITLGQKAMAASLPVVLASDQSALAVSQSGTWNITNITGTVSLPTGAATSALQTTGNTSLSTIAGAVSGTEMQVDIVAALPAGTNLIGDVAVGVRTSGGTTPFRNLDVNTTPSQVKGTAGQVYWLHAINTTSAPLYLKFYNDTSANVTVGTTTPILTFPVPANADSDGAGFTFSVPNGVAFDTAITIAATTGVADSDTTDPITNGCIVNLGYA